MFAKTEFHYLVSIDVRFATFRFKQKTIAFTQLFKINKLFLSSAFHNRRELRFQFFSHKLGIELKLEFFSISDKRE